MYDFFYTYNLSEEEDSCYQNEVWNETSEIKEEVEGRRRRRRREAAFIQSRQGGKHKEEAERPRWSGLMCVAAY